MRPTLLAIIGKPLSGKDTQADLLTVAHPEAVKISPGHIMRGIREEGETHRFWSLIGPYIPMMEQGLKLPDGPTVAMVGEVVQEQIAEGKRLLIIAGSPRGMDQLEGFEQIARDTGAKFVVMHINADDTETYRRSAARNQGRVDDTPEVHKIRLDEYRTYVEPMVEQLRNEGRIIDVDGMRPREVVFSEMEMILRDRVLDPEISLPMMARR